MKDNSKERKIFLEDFILSEMQKYNADGVDFVPIFMQSNCIPPIYKSYTKEEWLASDRSYPKLARRYWKIVNGKKEYIK